MNRILSRVAMATALFTLSFPAFAHVTLESKDASLGASYKAVFKVPHGCDGAATTEIAISVPEGYYSVKPMPHAGWSLDVDTGPYAQTYKNHGEDVTEGVKTVTWSGGNLPDAYYDEFVLTGTFADSLGDGTVFSFPVLQTCENGQTNQWTATADHAEGEPAPKVTLHAGQAADEHAGMDMGGMTMGDAPANGAAVTLGDLSLSAGFARATLPNAPVGAAYVTITNTGPEDDRLVSVSSPLAGKVQLHNMSVENGVMKMQEMEDGIPIPAGQTVILKPGGLHIMLMQLNQQLKEGGTVPVTLTFDKAGTVTLDIDIRDPGAMNAGVGGIEMSHGG